jgi:8-oxo-dGTP pyrophosphatase MutT (NUDIX family)
MYGLPMGRHDVESETELEAAQRELREETGLIFDTWRLIDITQPDRKVESFVYVFLATDFVEEVEQVLDGGERISVKLMDRDEAVAAAKSDASRYLPTAMLESLGSIDELANLPQYGLES